MRRTAIRVRVDAARQQCECRQGYDRSRAGAGLGQRVGHAVRLRRGAAVLYRRCLLLGVVAGFVSGIGRHLDRERCGLAVIGHRDLRRAGRLREVVVIGHGLIGRVDGLRGLVGVSRGNLQTSRVELLLMFLHPGLLDLTELRIADRRTQRGEGEPECLSQVGCHRTARKPCAGPFGYCLSR